LVRERDRRKIVWPSYFDVKLSRVEGRRLPKAYCIENPDLAAISGALKTLKLSFETQQDTAYPSCWWKKEGRALVDTELQKTELLREIAHKLKMKK